MLTLIERRNDVAEEIIKLRAELVEEKLLDAKEQKTFIKEMQQLVQSDICWMISKSSTLNRVWQGTSGF